MNSVSLVFNCKNFTIFTYVNVKYVKFCPKNGIFYTFYNFYTGGWGKV